MKQSIINMKKQLYLLLLGLALSLTAVAQTTAQLTNEFDKLLTEQFKADGPGCTALVAHKGQVIYQKAFGMANLELNVPMQPDNVFRIGSITKQFTAIAILQLMEQGKLSLQDEITRFIPDYPTQGKKITVEHLLTHTSGIKSTTDMPTFWSMIRKDMTPPELIDIFKNQPLEFDPGTNWKYCNSGYGLLGYIIEKVSKKTYPQYLEEAFFKPLGMTQSYFGSNTKLIKNQVAGYESDSNGVLQNASYISMTIPYLERNPALSTTHLAFAYAGDIYLADRNGQNPQRLTVPPEAETEPFFSPDGTWIAFSGNYNGNNNIYVVSVKGGIPRRLTFHLNADIMRGWTPDSKRILFVSNRQAHSKWCNQFFTVSLQGGFPERLNEVYT